MILLFLFLPFNHLVSTNTLDVVFLWVRITRTEEMIVLHFLYLKDHALPG